MAQVRYDIDFLRQKSNDYLVSLGLSVNDANITIDSMLSADMCGVNTHGIRMLKAYADKVTNGSFALEQPLIERQTDSITVINANNTIGAVSACFAVDIAVKKAKEHGVHAVFSHNANTFGPAFYYVERAAAGGQIGFICSNSPAAMPVYNGLEAMLGTNPFAFSCPTLSHGNITIDIATSVVAKSKFSEAKENGELLQPGWALDKDGNPTIDPDAGINGLVLPMAGFKGYGIALIIDLMSGLLSGAAFLNKVEKFYSASDNGMNVGHMFVAFNPEIIFGDGFLQAMDSYVETIRNSKTLSGKTVIVPGDNRSSKRNESIEHGIALSPDTVQKLESIFGEKLLEKI